MANNQEDEIKEYLIEHKSITPDEAKAISGSTRLSAIIFNLRHRDGWKIKTVDTSVKNRYGNTSTFATYVLEEKGK